MINPTTVSDVQDLGDIPGYIRQVFARALCLYSKDQVDAALDYLAEQIEAQLAHSNPIFLCVVVGGIVPMGHLLVRLNFPLEVDYVHATRYRGKTTGADLHWKMKPSCNMKGRTIVIVDDILDGGLTLSAICDYCQEQGARQVFTAVLVDKDRVREAGGLEKADFSGLVVEDRYVFGYGLDYRGYLRNAPGIYMIAPEDQ